MVAKISLRVRGLTSRPWQRVRRARAADPQLEGTGEIVSGMSHLAGVLASRQYPGLRMTVEFHPGMGHSDVMGPSVVRGLRTFYAKQDSLRSGHAARHGETRVRQRAPR